MLFMFCLRVGDSNFCGAEGGTNNLLRSENFCGAEGRTNNLLRSENFCGAEGRTNNLLRSENFCGAEGGTNNLLRYSLWNTRVFLFFLIKRSEKTIIQLRI
jgi:hypothetical protein